MKHNQLLERFTELLAQNSREIEISVAAQRLDTARVSEQIVLGLLREVCGFKHLKNLNATEARNFPGLDLIDEVNRIGVQVTATPTLEKIRETIETCKRHGLDSKIDRLIVYVLVQRQGSYAQASIDRIGAQFRFDAARDVVDYLGLAKVAETIEPIRLTAAVTLLEAYLRGVPVGLADTDFDPPASPPSKVLLNLMEVYFPNRLFVANLLDVKPQTGGRRKGERDRVRAVATELGRRLPSDFMVRSGQIITFHDLEQSGHPFEGLIDPGTVTPLTSREFYSIDPDHESTFKGLLRFTLQQKLFQHKVTWKHDDGLFVFLPDRDPDMRKIVWEDKKKSTRRVFERKLNNKDPSKTLICKHFAFAVDFVRADSKWHVALAPDWFFSYGDGFQRSRFADKPLSWLKRNENNRSVLGHFRFLCAWLKGLDGDDLFNPALSALPSLTFAEGVTFTNYPPLDDEQWLPVRMIEPDLESEDFYKFGEDS